MPYREHIWGYHFTMPYSYEMFQWHGNTFQAKFWGLVLPFMFYPMLWISEFRTQRKEHKQSKIDEQEREKHDRPGSCSMWNGSEWDEL